MPDLEVVSSSGSEDVWDTEVVDDWSDGWTETSGPPSLAGITDDSDDNGDIVMGDTPGTASPPPQPPLYGSPSPAAASILHGTVVAPGPMY